MCIRDSYVIAFEPNDESFYCAKETVRLNGLDDVELYRAALGEQTHPATLVKKEIIDGKHFDLGGGSFVHATEGEQECHVVTIDSIVGKKTHVSVIHLDVEGHEAKALLGAMTTIERWRPVIILETVPAPAWLNEHLAPLGYRYAGTVDRNTIFSQVEEG